MRSLFPLAIWIISLVLLSACGSPADQVTPVLGPATPAGSNASPASTPLPANTPTEVQTAISTAVPTPAITFTPTFTPETQVQQPNQFPDPGQYEWQLITSGLNSPVGLANSRDGMERLFVVEQSGRIRVVSNRLVQAQPFLDITEKISCCGERGLLGLAFHPRYSENGFFFVNYTDINGNTVIARYAVMAVDPNQADPDSEVRLLEIEQPYPNHNGGGMAFGLDGFLYVALGDGGSGGDPLGNAQNTSSLLGKLLRLDVDQEQGYAVPPDNPFAGGGGAPEVWVYGLRNPWRFSFDRRTGDLYIGDVGQGSWEEIDYLPAGHPGGANFGWNYREGAHPYGDVSPPENLDLIDPIAEYGRDQGYSVIGGLVYRGQQLPEWEGIYLYGDYGSGYIWGLFRSQDNSWEKQLLFQTGSSITSFGEDEQGELYYVDQGGGLYRLVNR